MFQTIPTRLSSVRTAAAALIGASVLTLATSAQAAEGKLKIATVSMQQLFNEYYKTAASRADVDKARKDIQEGANVRTDALKSIEENLKNLRKQLEDPSISEAKKKSVYAEFQMQQQQGAAQEQQRRDFLETKNKALNESIMLNMKSLLEEIQKVVEEDAKAGEYDYVFDKSGLSTTQVPFLLYTRDATDLTAEILVKLNKDAPKDAAAPAATPATPPKTGTGK